jgi:hypothetical protein
MSLRDDHRSADCFLCNDGKEACKCGRPLFEEVVTQVQDQPPMFRVDRKPTNPKDAVSIDKAPLRSVVPMRVLAEVAVALLEGALKYGRFNWRDAGVRASVYQDAVGRHLDAWQEGQDYDPDSGLSHITKAIAGLVILRDSMLEGNWTDDRKPVDRQGSWVVVVNERAKALIAKYGKGA